MRLFTAGFLSIEICDWGNYEEAIFHLELVPYSPAERHWRECR